MNKTYFVDHKKLVQAIIADVRKHRFICEVGTTDLPVVEDPCDFYNEIELQIPYLTGVTLGDIRIRRALEFYVEGKNYLLYSLQVIHYTREFEHPIITAGFSTGWDSRVILFEEGTYRIIRNDFVDIIKRLIQDKKDQKYRFNPCSKKKFQFR